MTRTWNLLLIPSFSIFLLILAVTQGSFLYMSLFEDLDYGNVGDQLTAANFQNFLAGSIYLRSLWVTVKLSSLAIMIGLVLAFPVAYILVRWQSRWAAFFLVVIVASSFVSVVIKSLGLNIIFGADGPMNVFLRNLGVISQPLRPSGETKVLIGLAQYAVGFMVLLLYGVLQSIPRSLEDAARVHGAPLWRVFLRVLIPLSLPGITNGALIVFNLCMGAFTTAALLGGGRVLTLPVLIQQTLMVETRYGMAAALATVLLVLVVAINLISVFLLGRGARGKSIIA